MRVITGIARGRKLQTLEGRDIRPTTDRVKEAMFSIIQFEVQGAFVLDLFAGSGSLGIEALSRGARHCVFVDNSRESQAVIKQNLQTTGLLQNARVMATDAAAYLQSCKETIDIALLDPPYHQGLVAQVLPKLCEKMRDTGVIVCETQIDETLPQQAGNFQIFREYRYGKIKLTIYRNNEGEPT